MARYTKFSDFIYTLVVFGLGILFSIYRGLTRGNINEELEPLREKVMGERGQVEVARKGFVEAERRVYRVRAVERIVLTLTIITALCCYKSKDMTSLLVTRNGIFVIPATFFVIGALKFAAAHLMEKLKKARKVL